MSLSLRIFTELEAGEGPALEHAEHCPLCTAIIEEHRLLEKDLCRLADPLPPPDLVHKVMARPTRRARRDNVSSSPSRAATCVGDAPSSRASSSRARSITRLNLLVMTASIAPIPDSRNTGATASWMTYATALISDSCGAAR